MSSPDKGVTFDAVEPESSTSAVEDSTTPSGSPPAESIPISPHHDDDDDDDGGGGGGGGVDVVVASSDDDNESMTGSELSLSEVSDSLDVPSPTPIISSLMRKKRGDTSSPPPSRKIPKKKSHKRSKSTDVASGVNFDSIVRTSSDAELSSTDDSPTSGGKVVDVPSSLSASKKPKKAKSKRKKSARKKMIAVRKLWRDFEKVYDSDDPSNDPHAQTLMVVPANIVQVNRTPRLFNTTTNTPASAISEFKGILPDWMASIIHFYTADYVYVNYGDSSVPTVVPSPRADRATTVASAFGRGRQTITITPALSEPSTPSSTTTSSPVMGKKSTPSRIKNISSLRKGVPRSVSPFGPKGRKMRSGEHLIADDLISSTTHESAMEDGGVGAGGPSPSPSTTSEDAEVDTKDASASDAITIGSSRVKPSRSTKRSLSGRNLTLASPVYVDEAMATEAYSEERFAMAQERLNTDRGNLFVDAGEDEARIEEDRIEPFSAPSVTRVVLSASGFEFECSHDLYEPLFCSISVYDVKKRAKLCETFYFEHNEFIDEELCNVTFPLEVIIDKVTQSKRAMFYFQDPNPHVYIVMRVSRMLWPDMEKEDAFFFKPKSVKPKAIARAKRVLSDFLDAYPYKKSGPMRVPFCWGFASLFPSGRRVAIEGDITIDNFHHIKNPITDEQVIESILSDKVDKRKAVCMSYTLNSISVPFDDLVENVVDANLEPLKPVSHEPGPLIRDMPTFSSGFGAKTPFTNYKNNIYLFPDAVNCKMDKSTHFVMMEARLKESDEDLETSLCNIFGRSNSSCFTSVGTSSISRQTKLPQFADELKVKLPVVLTERHHILFTILGVHSNTKKGAYTTIGYAVLPLFDGRTNLAVLDGVHCLVVHKTLSPGYLSEAVSFLRRTGEVTNNTVAVEVRMDSTVYPSNPRLVQFLKAMSAVKPQYENTGNASSEIMTKAIGGLNDLSKVGIEDATQYFPSILHETLRVLTCNVPHEVKKKAVVALIGLLKRVCGRDAGSTKNPTLYSYVHFVLDIPENMPSKNSLHVSLCTIWLQLIEEEHMVLEGFHASWFLLEAMAKSMAIHVDALGLFADDHHRVDRFPQQFTLQLKKLIDVLFSCAEGLRNLEAITFLPMFLRKLLNLMDRGAVFEMIYTYMKNLPESQLFGRFKFLRALVQHEHYLPISRPLHAPNLTSVKLSVVLRAFWRRHFLPGLVVHEVNQALEQTPGVRAQAHVTLRQLLVRAQNSLSHRDALERAITMYFPIVPLLLDNSDRLLAFKAEEQREWLVCWLVVARHTQPNTRSSWWTRDTPQRMKRFLRFLRATVELFEEFHRFDTSVHDAQMLTAQTHVEVCCTVLELLLGFMKDVHANRNNTSASVTDTGVVAYISELTKLCRALLHVRSSRVQLSTFDALEFLLHTFAVPLHTTPEGDGFCEMLSYELLVMANSRQSTIRDTASSLIYLLLRIDYEVHGSLARTSTMFTVGMSKLVGGREQRTEDVVRTDLVALRTSLKGILEFSGGVVGVKSSNDAAFSASLVARGGVPSDVEAVIASAQSSLALAAAGEGAEEEAAVDVRAIRRERRRTSTMVITPQMIAAARTRNARNTTGLDREIGDLVARLSRLADYSTRLEASEGDPEALSECYLSISRDYADSPDLRVRWLDNLASFHLSHKHYVEAVQCKVLLAAMVEQYLRHHAEVKQQLLLPSQYEALGPNVSKYLKSAPLPSTPAAFHNSETWQPTGVLRYLRESAQLLEDAGAHELCLEVQSLMVVALKQLKNYHDLSSTLKHFQTLTTRLIEAAGDVRVFPKYYRVSFFGQLFEELDGISYIYKVSGGMKLGKFQERLKGQFAKLVGGDSSLVEMLQNNAKATEFDPSRLYIQIGSVQPYFDSSETWRRGTEHERSFGIDKFIFESGVAAKGKNVAASVAEQQKKKTIFTVEEQFPSLNTRLKVIRTEDVIISPLENAIELLEGRNTTIRGILNANPPRMNAIHQVLSGSVAVVVNEGPLAVAEAFLTDGAVGMDGEAYDGVRLEALRGHISEFLRLCAFALKLSASLISEEHIPFQKHCEGKYEELKENLGNYL